MRFPTRSATERNPIGGRLPGSIVGGVGDNGGVLERPSPSADKTAWRLWAKARRAALEREALSARVVAALLEWPPYQQAEHVLAYAAFGSELELDALYADPGKVFYLTRASRAELSVHPLAGGLERHRYGFWQPAAGALPVSPEQIDLALVPGLAFDRAGERLGYGQGFYDRLLPRLRPAAPRVGVVAGALIVPRLPSAPHDVPMTHLASEDGVRPCPLDEGRR